MTYENVDVQYCKEPEWEITLREFAESDSNSPHMRVHVGSHYCEFSVEESPEGAFAIRLFIPPRTGSNRHQASKTLEVGTPPHAKRC